LKELQKKVQQQQQQHPYCDEASSSVVSLLPQHAVDYVLIGSNVWLLLSSKFGHDASVLPCSCVYNSNSHPSNNHPAVTSTPSTVVSPVTTTSRILVEIPYFGSHTTYIPVPTTGRFPYEQYFQNQPSSELFRPEQQQQRQCSSSITTLPLTTVASTPNVVASPPPASSSSLSFRHGDNKDNDDDDTTTGIDSDHAATTTAISNTSMDHDSNDDDDDRRGHVGSYHHHTGHSTSSSRRVNHPPPPTEDTPGRMIMTRSTVAATTTTTTSILNSPITTLAVVPHSTTTATTTTTGELQSPPYRTTATTSSHLRNYNSNNNISSTVVLLRRKYGSGLGNLGNTCFMNSTIQCLGHTMALQNYFLSNQYQQDLNRQNPLGTGGELATQFALLLYEMWISKSIIRNNNNNNNNSSSTNGDRNENSEILYTTASNVVYPKDFKYTLGKHAAQFMGYDQHDSQELATYLLDALHEDCNRITNKPYIEKPEQADKETDQEASDKAWELHLQREDSHVLEYFMGQVKSRVQCNQEHCQRVSTTFDPFMFLSVPIPGSDDRTIRFTFVPLDPNVRPKKLSVKVSKIASVEDMLRRIIDMLPATGCLPSTTMQLPLPGIDDFVVCDIWKKEVFDWLQNKDDIEKIRETDETYIYQVRSSLEIRQHEAQLNDETANYSNNNNAIRNGDLDTEITQKLGFKEWKRHSSNTTTIVTNRQYNYQLDVITLTRLNRNEEWSTFLQTKYMKAPLMYVNAFHPKKGSSEERVRIYNRLSSFLDQLHKALDYHNSVISDDDDEAEIYGSSSGPKRVRADNVVGKAANSTSVMKVDEPIPDIMDCSGRNSFFRGVQTLHDIVVLEFIANKMFREIINAEREKKDIYPNGVVVEVRIRCMEMAFATTPFIMRLTSNTTVFQFRELMGHRLSRCLRSATDSNNGGMNRMNNVAKISNDIWTNPDESGYWDEKPQQQCYEPPPVSENGNATRGSKDMLDSSSVIVPFNTLRQIPLVYERKNSVNSHRTYIPSKPLGSVVGRQPSYVASTFYGRDDESQRPVTYALPDHIEEKEYISDIVGNYGIIYLNVPSQVMDDVFDMDEFQSVDDESMVTNPSSMTSTRQHSNSQSMTVLDCIEKFCQMEQLEESEQWYCSNCKQHVCAWKQFHIYRSPPHLIVHLKRFQYSARTHRRQKINTHVDFPLIGLDLSNQVLHWTENEKPIYDCYAVSNHYGGLGGGHYTAYALNDDGVWCHYDDSRITSHVDPSEVVSQAAYVLYYRRRDVPVRLNFAMISALPVQPPESPLDVFRRHDNQFLATSNHADLLFRGSREPSEISSTVAMIDDDEDPNERCIATDLEDDDGSHSSVLPSVNDGRNGCLLDVIPNDDEMEEYSNVVSNANPNHTVGDDNDYLTSGNGMNGEERESDDDDIPTRASARTASKNTSNGADYNVGSSLPLQ
jgi:ubiquitin C-terminal hydrolase